ncbi:hypothetical protein EVAR_13976_1 [Eumeta japonica]|uniref:Uncharacterized protein n=1 Tax=Eumeta variegata TaxID=151549 RepID=A0A4C1U8J1_EUMVA|nr:hypothetical protein EVAR_13976_1 [Eumeta japonica]
MIDFQGLMMELPNFQLHYHILKAYHGQSEFHDNTNKPKQGYAALFHYGVLTPTFRLHHHTLETNQDRSVFQDNFNNREHRSDTLFNRTAGRQALVLYNNKVLE